MLLWMVVTPGGGGRGRGSPTAEQRPYGPLHGGPMISYTVASRLGELSLETWLAASAP
jgi:hypothetical protein